LAAKTSVFVVVLSSTESVVKLIFNEDLLLDCNGVKFTVATRSFPLSGVVLPRATCTDPLPPTFSASTPNALLFCVDINKV
jgi:hypothetical protein